MKQATDILGTVTASVADEIGISRDVKVVMGSPDHQCACIGSGAVRDFEGHLYIKIYTATKKTYQKLLQLPESTIGKRPPPTATLTACDKIFGGCDQISPNFRSGALGGGFD